jgi:hypothetical protein
LCETPQDVQNWTSKLIQYEQNPGNGDNSYLMKSLMTQADQLQAGYQYTKYGYLPAEDQADIVASYLPQFTHTIFSEKPLASSQNPYRSLDTFAAYAGCAYPQFPKGADVISKLNTNFGIYSIMNHGSPNGFAVASNGILDYGANYTYVVCYQGGWRGNYNSNLSGGYPWIQESGNGFNNLTNYNYPTIVYSQSCQNMPFDSYQTPAGTRNLGASFTVVNKGGGPAYLGNTRDGDWTLSYNLETKFANQLTNGFANLGVAEANSKMTFGADSTFAVILSHNLSGCPETPMWTAIPSTFNPTITENGTTVTVTPNTPIIEGGPDFYNVVTIMSALDNGKSYDSVKSETVGNLPLTFTGVVKPYYVTITKVNYLPYLKNPTTVYIQDQTLSGITYLSCQTVSAGFNVTNTMPTGNVLIQNGANVTFDVTGNVLLDKGFEVQAGASFEIK